MPIVTPLEHISPSQVEMYRRCPAQYYYRYIRGIKIPPNSSLTRGLCVHSGAAFNYKQKIQSYKDLPLPEVTEYVASEFETLKDETEWAKDEKPGQIKDQTVNLYSHYHKEFAPLIQPLFVEQEILLPLENYGFQFKGYIDLVDVTLFIRDLKTSARTPNQDALEKSLQLSGYAWGLYKLTGEMPLGVALDYLVNTKTPHIVTLTGTRTQQDFKRFINTVGKVAYGIQEGVFYPNENNFLCSPDKCGYWKLCHQDF